MEKKLIFSWAENADGKIVHVDEVPRGLQCGCSCPHCHERLMARHGDVREHGFAHHSDNRGANLEICYMNSKNIINDIKIFSNRQINEYCPGLEQPYSIKRISP